MSPVCSKYCRISIGIGIFYWHQLRMRSIIWFQKFDISGLWCTYLYWFKCSKKNILKYPILNGYNVQVRKQSMNNNFAFNWHQWKTSWTKPVKRSESFFGYLFTVFERTTARFETSVSFSLSLQLYNCILAL